MLVSKWGYKRKFNTDGGAYAERDGPGQGL